VMPKVDHFAELALEQDDHAASDLGCWNCHYVLQVFLFGFSRVAIDKNHATLANEVV
jgi:hypothetical protein